MAPSVGWYGICKEARLARQNYGFEKRQKELARKKKKEEKRLRKLERAPDQPDDADQDEAPEGVDEGPAD